MITKEVSRLGIAMVATLAVSGCLGSGGGGAGGGGGGSGDYDASFDRVSHTVATQDMPTKLQADYTGAMKVDVTQDATKVGKVTGDLDLKVDWVDGQSTTKNPFTGTASNFRGSFNGEPEEDIAGTLTVDNGPGGVISREVFTLPAPASGTVAVGALQLSLKGELSTDDVTVNTDLLLGGNFVGSGASGAWGTVAGGVKEVGSTNPGLFDAGVGGTFYLEKQ